MIHALRTRLSTLWVAPATPTTTPPVIAPRTTAVDATGRAILWPIATLLILHTIIIKAINGSVTDDFSTVYYALRRFHDGTPIYNEIYEYVDPHYLYSPGATLVLSPIGLLTHFDAARLSFICINAAAIIAALAILTRLSGYSLRSVVFPASVCAAFLTEAVTNTLVFSNINGVLLLALAGYLFCLLRNKPWAAGVIIGLAILVKPIFLPLLFFPAVMLNLRTLFTGVAVPLMLNVIAWPIVPGAGDYVVRTIPYLREVRDYANSSLPGIATYYGMPAWQEKVWFFIFAAIVAVGVLILLRWRFSDPFLWITTTSALLLSGVFFLSSLGQMYYSMLLFPVLFTVLHRRSVMHTWVSWIAVYCFLSPNVWFSDRFVDAGRIVHYLKPTVGWGLFLICITTTAFVWWLQERRTHPLADAAPHQNAG